MELTVVFCRKHADSLKSRIKVKPPARVKLKHEPEVLVKHEGPSEKRLKTEGAVKVKKEEDGSIEDAQSLRSQVKQEHPSAASQNQSKHQTHDPLASEQEDAGLGALLGMSPDPFLFPFLPFIFSIRIYPRPLLSLINPPFEFN